MRRDWILIEGWGGLTGPEQWLNGGSDQIGRAIDYTQMV